MVCGGASGTSARLVILRRRRLGLTRSAWGAHQGPERIGGAYAYQTLLRCVQHGSSTTLSKWQLSDIAQRVAGWDAPTRL